MKCLICESYSWHYICKHCQKEFLTPHLYSRKLSNGVQVFSFYNYEEIKHLLFTKHTDLGFYIYKLLAQNSFQLFAKEFNSPLEYISLGIDDVPKNGYSHTAILNHALRYASNITPLFHILRANSNISYSGKSKIFRETNPRNFTIETFKGDNIILVDDIITTGTTLNEAIKLLEEKGKKVSFCLTLSDVSFQHNFI